MVGLNTTKMMQLFRRACGLSIAVLMPVFIWVETSFSQADFGQQLKSQIVNDLDEVNKRVEGIGRPPCIDCTISNFNSGNGASLTQDQCQKRYDDLFKDNELNIHISIGYMDLQMGPDVPKSNSGRLKSRDTVIDRYVQEALVEKLVKGCSGQMTACNFKRAADDASSIERQGDDLKDLDKSLKQELVGQVGKNPIKIRINRSSYSHSDSFNRQQAKSDQRRISETSRNDFKDALAGEADVVIYAGHMRYGSAFWEGAGFYPPVLLEREIYNDSIGSAESGISCPSSAPQSQFEQYDPEAAMDPVVNERCYKQQVGTTGDLAQVGSAKFVAIFGCDSNKTLVNQILRRVDTKQTSVILVDGLPHSLQSLSKMVYATLEGVFGRRCEKEFLQLIQNIGINREGAKKGYRIKTYGLPRSN